MEQPSLSRADRRTISTSTPSRTLDDATVAALVKTGGYVHPLFAATTDNPRVPVPGPALLYVAAGLVEQSGVLDQAQALLAIDEVRFHGMVFAGSTIRVEVTWLDERRTTTGRLLEQYRWTIVSGHPDEVVAEATVLMMMQERS